MIESSERIKRALALADGNRLRAALYLDRWAGILRANDPTVADSLAASARTMASTEIKKVKGPFSRRKSWRFRER
jgi:hypothetical protein